MERWCDDLGGEYYDSKSGRTKGRYGCHLDDIHRFEVDERSGRPNLIEFKGRGVRKDLGLAQDAELSSEDDRFWVDSTEGIVGVDMVSGEMFEEAPRASKLALRQKREDEATMY